jgi:hypothetical protein
VSVETFTAAQLEKRKRRVRGLSGWSSAPRRRTATRRVYALRSRISCGICERKMEGAARRGDTIYYRCNARTLVPESRTALAHPLQVYLREDRVTTAINRWIGELFSPLNRREMVETLFEADDTAGRHEELQAQLRDRIAAAQVVMGRMQKALDAGWDPAELREQYNAAAAEKHAAEAALARCPREAVLTRSELESYVDQLGDIGLALGRAEAEERRQLYESLRYHHVEQIVDLEIDPLADRLDKLPVSEARHAP